MVTLQHCEPLLWGGGDLAGLPSALTRFSAFLLILTLLRGAHSVSKGWED